jgi:tetratricopeptide (TPR) repeat protein
MARVTTSCAGITVMDPTPEQSARLRQYFDEAVDLPPPEREALIERVRRDEGDEMADQLANMLMANEPTHTIDAPPGHLPRPAEPKEPSAFREGEVVLGRFRIVRKLGEGGMGEVYEAHDLVLGAAVALKTVRRDLIGDRGLLRRFKWEVQHGKQVTSQYVCRIHELFTLPQNEPHSPVAFLTMELLEGTTLAKRIKHGPVPWSEAEPIAMELCQGLEAIHAAGLVHRDFKPGNAMLAKRKKATQAVVMDFGLALQPEESPKLTRTGGFVGTIPYMAPEQFGGKVSPATDIYALGAVLYEMATGKQAFDTETPPAERRRPPAASSTQPGVPRCVDRVIHKCLEPEPASRFQTAADVAKALSEDADGGFRRARVLTTRRKLILAGTAALALVCGALEREEIESLLDQLVHPLPRKRWVAVLAWPASPDHGVRDTLSGVIDAIENELSRAEAFDRDFYVVASHTPTDAATSVAKLAQIIDPLGVNLVLAAIGALSRGGFELRLKLLDPSSGSALRAKLVPMAGNQLANLPAKAVQTAASLLGVGHYVTPGDRLRPPATSPEAFKALQAADALRKQPNDAGLEASIEKYKEAIDLDSHFAAAHSRLATAYCRLHALQHDPAALDLAEGNARAALNADANLVEGHLALSYVFQNRDDQEAAVAEISKAVALDPLNPMTRVWQADLYTSLNRLPEAESFCRLVIKSRPNYWLAHQDLGLVLDRQCKYREALKEFRAASLALPKDALPLTNVGLVQSKLGMYPEAYDTFHKSMALIPYAPAAFGLAQLLRAAGRFSEALQSAQQAVKLDPREDQYWLELGDCFSGISGHTSEASNAYRRALRDAEDKLQSVGDASTWMLVALYRLKAGVYGSSADAIAKAESMGANDADSQLCKVRILELTGQRDKALDTLATSLRGGVTIFQVDFIADLQSLRRDPRYLGISKLRPA